MNNPFFRAPHVAAPHPSGSDRVGNAALLIDFDNVTMGIRSDLSRELRALLDSEVIRGKVAVQRAYADWRRYPQYIVPLSEASIDLIFAPAYGSSKKNATDIRLAIDALELVFIRPEIGTFILLSGDSDFSSLVLKLKEYGKFVIGVGLQESSSDILVQNCDEYYSYNTLTGLTKTDEAERVEFDPWVLVEKAVERMVERRDVMRSDRLKQVMVELDPSFEERKFGFARFSKFLAEAAGKGLITLKKLDNGQFEVSAGKKRKTGKRTRRSARPTADAARSTADDAEAKPSQPDLSADADAEADAAVDHQIAETMDRAYTLMREALEELREAGRDPARDSDVKRRMLKLRASFDEAELGFPKFSKFLKQAADDRIVRIERLENGQFEVRLPGGRRGRSDKREAPKRGRRKESGERKNTNDRRKRSRTDSKRSQSSSDSSSPENGTNGAEVPVGETTATEKPSRSRSRSSRTKRTAPEEDNGAPTKRKSAAREKETVAVAKRDPAPAVEERGAQAEQGGTPSAEAPSNPTADVAPPAEASAPKRTDVQATDTPEAPAPERSSARKSRPSDTPSELEKGGLLPRAQKRGARADGPPPIMEGQAIVIPGSSGEGAKPSSE